MSGAAIEYIKALAFDDINRLDIFRTSHRGQTLSRRGGGSRILPQIPADFAAADFAADFAVANFTAADRQLKALETFRFLIFQKTPDGQILRDFG